MPYPFTPITTASGDEAQAREYRVVKLLIAAPEDEGVALLGRLQRDLHPCLEVVAQADFDFQQATLREAPLVIFGESPQALGAGGAYLLLALVADDQGRYQLAPIDCRVEEQVPLLAGLRNKAAFDLHLTPPIVITESAAGLGIAGEVRCLNSDYDMAWAIWLAMEVGDV
jgi:hypothetical protein